MALPSALKKKNQELDQAIRLRSENLTRLARGQGPTPLPEPVVLLRQPEIQQAPKPAPEPAQSVEPPQVHEPQELGNAQPAQPAADPDEMQRLRARAETTEGMLRKTNDEKRQLEELSKRQIDEANRRAEAAERLAEQLQRQQPAAPLTREELLQYVTEAQLVELGEDQCRATVAAVKAIERNRGNRSSNLEAEIKAVRSELESLRAQQTQDLRKSREAAFWATVNGTLPRWREVNKNADFLKWLNEHDPIAGRTRQDSLNEARSALDAERVVAIFNTWIQAQPKPSEPRDPLRRVIPNGKPSAAQPIDTANGPIVTRAEMAEHNQRLSKDRRYRGSEEALQAQQRFDQAAREGRIA